MDINKVILDIHTKTLLDEFQHRLPQLDITLKRAYDCLTDTLRQQNIRVSNVKCRMKDEVALRQKLELMGAKCRRLEDVTDILGLRVITFYADDVDKVSAIVRKLFDVNYKYSVERKQLERQENLAGDVVRYVVRTDFPIEIQIVTSLQHVWIALKEETGLKDNQQLPREYRRQFNLLAGMLEHIDTEFGQLRTAMADYRRRIHQLVDSGKLSEVPLNEETFRNYIGLRPFDALNQRIAAINQSELYPAPLLPFLPVLQDFQLETLGDVETFIDQNADDAYQLALHQLANTDLDILAENIALQNLCVVHMLKAGGGRMGLKVIFDIVNGENDHNETQAANLLLQATDLPFMKKQPIV